MGDKMEKLSIGKMASLNNTTIQTLRLYDKMGILKPIFINEETGYRYYDIKQCAKLDMIQYMKATGMELKEIKDVFEHQDISLLNEVLRKHLTQLDQQIEALKLSKKAITRMSDSFDRYLKSPKDGMITLEYIEERKIYYSYTNTNFYDYGIEVYENLLRKLKHEMKKVALPNIYYYNAGTIISKENFIKKQFISNELFVFVDEEIFEYPQIKTLASGMYVCMYCDDFDKEKEYIMQLYQYIEDHHYQITGDYICEVISELLMNDKKRQMFIRLQIPVKF